MLCTLLSLLPQDIGVGSGKNYAVNFPLRDGIDDEGFKSIFRPVRDCVCGCVCGVRAWKVTVVVYCVGESAWGMMCTLLQCMTTLCLLSPAV